MPNASELLPGVAGCSQSREVEGTLIRINSKEVRVNKRDSPRISKEIHIDRKQPLGVSLKGSSERVLATCGLDENPESSTGKSASATRQKVSVPARPNRASWGQQVSRSSRLMVWGT